MMNKLFNPFYYIAGVKSLLLGVSIILLTSLVGYLSKTHFPDAISVKTAPSFPVLIFFVQNLVNWLVVSSIFYVSALLFSKSSVRMIDIYGTQALARSPYFIAAFIGFSDALNKFGKYTLWMATKKGAPVEISSLEIGIAVFLTILSLLLIVWVITLMLNAFKVAANIKGSKLAFIFVPALIISIIATLLINKSLMLFLLK